MTKAPFRNVKVRECPDGSAWKGEYQGVSTGGSYEAYELLCEDGVTHVFSAHTALTAALDKSGAQVGDVVTITYTGKGVSKGSGRTFFRYKVEVNQEAAEANL